jgi:hypothetical protein
MHRHDYDAAVRLVEAVLRKLDADTVRGLSEL